MFPRICARIARTGDLRLNLRKFAAPGVPFVGEELLVDPVLQPIRVEPVETALQLGGLGRELLRSIAGALALPVDLLKDFPQNERHVVWDLDSLNPLEELLLEILFPEVLTLALARGLAAVQVDEALLLHLGGDGAPAALADGEAAVGKLALCITLGPRRPAELAVGLLPEFTRDDPLESTLVEPPAPVEIAVVDRILDDPFDPVLADLRAFAGGKAIVSSELRHLLQRIEPRGIALEGAADVGSLFLDVSQRPFLPVPAISHGRDGRVLARLRLLHLALGDFLGEVVHVVLGHEHLDTVDELCVGGRLAAEDFVLLDEVDARVALSYELVEGRVVLQVPVNAVGLLDKDRDGCKRGPDEPDHLAEMRAPGLPRRFDIHKLMNDLNALFRGIPAKQVELRADGEALFLFFGGNTGVDHGAVCRPRHRPFGATLLLPAGRPARLRRGAFHAVSFEARESDAPVF